MKHLVLILQIFLTLTCFQLFASPISLEVDPVPIKESPSRIGINLGQWKTWGGEQYGKNLIQLPGFEGEIDRLIVFVTRSNKNSFSDEKHNAYSDGLWNGAKWEIRTGTSQGKKGFVKKSTKSGADGFPQYFSETPLPPLEKDDVIVLTKQTPGDIGRFWNFSKEHKSKISLDPTKSRPESPGSQSLLISPARNEKIAMSYYLDHLGKTAGKLIKIEGPWHFSIWLKAENEKGRITASFRRTNDTPKFFQKQIFPTTEWKKYSIDFIAKDTGNPALLDLKLEGEGAKIWVDDIFLGPVQDDNDTAFREEVIDALKELRPSVIRTKEYLGDTFDNRIAPPFERKYWIHRLRGRDTGSTIFAFSYQEFLDLCEEVNANPWFIIPTTSSNEKYFQFGEFLAEYANTNRFSEVVLEFGNENWNSMFRPQAFSWPHMDEHGLVAQGAFQNIIAGSNGTVSLNTMVNGQHVSPGKSFAYLDSTPNADTLAVAAYFMGSLNKDTPDSEILKKLFQDDPGKLKEAYDGTRERGKSFGIYEVNLHTSQGNAPSNKRDRVVAGAASGAALAKRLLYCLKLGADPIAVFNLAQFDSKAWDISDSVKLWGITRTFGPPMRFRPTGLAMVMLNRVISGDMYDINPIDSSSKTDKLTVAAFKPSDMWTAAIVSENEKPIELEILFPDDGHPMPTTYQILKSATPFETNEIDENVTIAEKTLETDNRTARFSIPAWGFVVLGSTKDTVPDYTQPTLKYGFLTLRKPWD